MDVGTDKTLAILDCWRSNFGHLTDQGKLVNFTSIFPQTKRKRKKYRQKMVVLLVIYKPLYWPIARWRFPIATCCTDHAVNVCTSNCSVTNHIFFMHLSLDQFLFSWLPLKAALTDIDYVFVVLRPECNSINIVYCSVHWGSFHTILDNWAAGTKTGAPDRALLFTHRIGDFTGISATEIICAAPILKVERDRISGRFLPFLVAVWTGIRIGAEVNK